MNILRQWRKGRSSNLKEHCNEVHGGGQNQFEFKVVRAFQNPVARLLEEAQRIRCEPGTLLNNKNESTRPVGCSLSVHRI